MNGKLEKLTKKQTKKQNKPIFQRFLVFLVIERFDAVDNQQQQRLNNNIVVITEDRFGCKKHCGMKPISFSLFLKFREDLSISIKL